MNAKFGDCEKLTLERRGDGQLCVNRDGMSSAVWIARCFPWSSRARFISLRDRDRHEVWLVDDPSTLDPASRQVLEAALIEADFVLEIERILAVDEEIEIRCWDVATRQGRRCFQTRRDEWPRVMPDGGILIRDVSDDLYHIARPAQMDRKSQQLLNVFID